MKFQQGSTGSLNKFEKRIAKRLLNDGLNSQDVHARILFGRKTSVNFARVTSVKADLQQLSATDEELEDFLLFKRMHDPSTGLNPFQDERLVRSREAMKLAVGVFNNPSILFRTQAFTVLSVIAWTYAVLEYAHRKGLPTERRDGKAISLSDFLGLPECALSDGVSNNLKSFIRLRDLVEHRLLSAEDPKWISLFQSCCLNYEKFITEQFGKSVSLAEDLSFSLQFSGLSLDQATNMVRAGLSNEVQAINRELFDHMTDAQRSDQEFQFSVIFTTIAASKSKAAFQFLSADSPEGKEISQVLVKHKPSAETHPFRVKDVVAAVKKRTGKNFNTTKHTTAWKENEVRPDGNSASPEKTKTDYCFYNPTFREYSYSQMWIDFLVNNLNENGIDE